MSVDVIGLICLVGAALAWLALVIMLTNWKGKP